MKKKINYFNMRYKVTRYSVRVSKWPGLWKWKECASPYVHRFRWRQLASFFCCARTVVTASHECTSPQLQSLTTYNQCHAQLTGQGTRLWSGSNAIQFTAWQTLHSSQRKLEEFEMFCSEPCQHPKVTTGQMQWQQMLRGADATGTDQSCEVPLSWQSKYMKLTGDRCK